MAGHVEWFGDRISTRMREASRVAINETMDDTVVVASGFLPGSLETEIIDHAKPVEGRMRGLWGSRNFLVWIYEVGSFRKPTGWNIVPKGAALDVRRGVGPVRSGRKRSLSDQVTLYGRRVHHPPIPARHALRKASDIVYPTLTLRLARAFAKGRS